MDIYSTPFNYKNQSIPDFPEGQCLQNPKNGFSDTLKEQVFLPIEDEVEMQISLDNIKERIASIDYYSDFFSNAFGTNSIIEEKNSLSLGQCESSMVSFQSKYDIGSQQVLNSSLNFPNFAASENNRKTLFLSNRLACGVFRGTDAFIATGSRDKGLDAIFTDTGVGGDDGNPNNLEEFKVGSLKNIGVSAPYVHNGKFASLQEVIDHYDN